MGLNEVFQLLRTHAQIVVCEHCKQSYGIIPDIEGIPKTLETAQIEVNGILYYRDKQHCRSCGICEQFVPKQKMYHPLGDAPICKQCYQSFKDSDSCYTFAEDIGESLSEDDW